MIFTFFKHVDGNNPQHVRLMVVIQINVACIIPHLILVTISVFQTQATSGSNLHSLMTNEEMAHYLETKSHDDGKSTWSTYLGSFGGLTEYLSGKINVFFMTFTVKIQRKHRQ
jgi:hypothetical protein